MKIGKLEFKEYAAKKPITLDSSGKFLTSIEIESSPTLSQGSLLSLSNDQQVRLAIARYEVEPEFTLAIIGVGLLSKSEIIDHIREQTSFGQLAVRAEMQYCNELMASLREPIVPTWPVVPERPFKPFPEWRRVRREVWIRLSNRALFCENTTDSVTTPFANYRIANVHALFQSKGFTVVSLTGTNDVRASFTPHAKSKLTVYIGGVGHGSYSYYMGHGGNRILEACQYDSAEVNDKAIHFLSCQTAAQLGPDTINKGARCYAGYNENFILQWDSPSTPAVNEFQLFAKSDSTFDLVMATCGTAQQAYDATIQAFNASIAQVPGQVAATYLTWDRDHLRLHGDATAVIAPYRWAKIRLPVTPISQQNALVEAGELSD